MSRHAAGVVTGTRLLAGFVLTAAVLGIAVTHPFDDDPIPTPVSPALVAAQSRSVDDSDRQQRALLISEDERLLRLVAGLRPGSAPYVQAVEGTETLVLTPRGLDYGLADLVAEGAAEVLPDGAVLLTRHVLVAPGARLGIVAPGGDLRLRSDATGITSLVAWKADLELAGDDGDALTVTSWDARSARPDDDVTDGRAYIRTVSGDLETSHVDVAGLGFWAGRTGGVALTGGSSGPATGTITDSSFEEGHYGVFVSETDGLEVTGSRFARNAIDGLTLHRRTVDTTVIDSTATGNDRNGVSADQGSEEVTLTGIRAARNAEYGVYFSGRPLSDGPSAGGASLRAYGNLAITGGQLTDNGKGGVRVVGANDVAIVGTEVADNRDGIVLVDTAAPTTVAGTTVTGDHRFGISATGGAATISDNRVTEGETAIRIRAASAAVTGNTVEEASNHGISVVGAAVATSVVDNTVAGRGPSGLDLHRLAPGVVIEQSGNDLEQWVRDRDNWVYWSTFVPNHPMLVLWVVILGAPLALGLRARRNRLAVGSAPYRDQIWRDRPAPRRADLGRPISPGGHA
ncbi:right-handed parallel beta-helix repeat-containing protein [Blastococcus goldschmidtiae]|uniref:Right-handed parallel beta-helix repeat-containing protein n=1 Tax=Blastococcus goldschmidtiae TaxID=3075546 RepID=A0ABU2KB00_9ACTN|nr:right-handed parallel beta-helix repeat-containing protein [Blastococcus sp. DSM 46792]MDT0277360.1 right-handed parallel beta-helix repeat-containing protein [Blastococcus sp. DSM 46792]